jgi:predicted unusual protein kinase regulating ubiquinone biosynthesis (AarF/ABC1/UbiB family)
MFNIKGKDSDKYFKEVEDKLMEETDYELELEQSQRAARDCSHIKGLHFPEYYSELSSEKVITMDWMDGLHLSEFAKTDFSKEVGNQIGQILWDFYMYQIHELGEVHADPHPGNFLVTKNHELIAIDFGCIKKIPNKFYTPYFELAVPKNINDPKIFNDKLKELEILRPDDTQEEVKYFSALFHEMLSLFTTPFHDETFDFGDEEFWEKVSGLSEKYSQDEQLRKMNGNRGSKHFIYINRTFFGLYNLLHDLKAKIDVDHYKRYIKDKRSA